METQLIPSDLPGLGPDLPILAPPVENTEIQKFENSPNPTSSTIQSEDNEAPHIPNPIHTDEIVVEENIVPEPTVENYKETEKPEEMEEVSLDQRDSITNAPSIQAENNNQETDQPRHKLVNFPIQEESENFLENSFEMNERENFEEELSNKNDDISTPQIEEESNKETNEEISVQEIPPDDYQSIVEEPSQFSKPEETPPNEKSRFTITLPIQEETQKTEPENNISPNTQTTSKSTVKAPYYPQFKLSNIPSINSFDQISTILHNELEKHGEIFKLEKEERSESSSYDVLFSFMSDKNAVIALKSPIWINLGNNENNVSRMKVEPTPGFIQFLTELSSALKNSNNTSSETKSSPLKNETQEKQSSNKNKSAESKSHQSAKKNSAPKKQVPLEIIKVHNKSPRKSAYSSRRRSSRSKSRSHSRDYDRESSYERDLSPKRYSRSDIKKRRESSGSIERSLRRERNAAKEFYSHGKPMRKGSMALEERKFMDNEIQRPRRNSSPKIKTICLVPPKNQKEDLRNTLKNQQHQQQRQNECWTDDQDDCEFTCYAIGVPLEYEDSDIKSLLKKEGFSGYIRVRTRNFEGLDYHKITFESKNDAQRALTKPIFVNDIPVIMIPKLSNRDPFSMLSFHQLKIRSLSGPIESKIVYEFLLKFGTITDFLILDLLEFPTTFLATFTNNASKRNLAACYPTNSARISDDKGREYSVQFELNIKPALVVRKKLKETIIYQYKEAAAQFLREMSRQIENEVIFTNPAVSSPSLNYSQQVPPPSLNSSSNPVVFPFSQEFSLDLISPVASNNPNPYTFSPGNAYSLSNQMSSMNLSQSPNGPFASRPPQYNNMGPLSLPPNQNFNYNQQQQQNTFIPNNRSHSVNTYIPHHQIPHYMQYEEPPGMIQETPYDVDKFLAGNGNPNQNPFNNLRGGVPLSNQENQYFLSNIGRGQNSSISLSQKLVSHLIDNYYQY